MMRAINDSPWKATTFFDYNIRSWPVTVYADSYMQELDFTPGGNVKAMRWRAEGDTAVRRYDFAYDGLGRLTSARYGAGTGAEGNYDTDYTYDAHGNILTLQRKGLHDGGRFALIDDLFCTYDGNRLVQVNDAATPPTYKDAHHFVDTRNWSVSGGDYDYDRCGNMVNDRNRGLTYRYDLNHQPCAIGTRGRTKRLRYTDDGVKIHEHYDYPPYFAEPSLPGSSDVTDCLDYCGDVTYRDGRLHSLDFKGGYLTFTADSVSGYHYYVSDHPGNVRAVVSDADSVEQVNHYYPFGILMGESRGGDVQRRKFGGKELDREWGLDLFDFEARRFDGMRFTQPDPLAEKYPDTSPYAFCLNNPLSYIDPTGEKTYLFATALPGYDKSIIATHTFIYVDNNNGKFKEQNYFAFGSKLSGVEGMVSGQLVRNYYEDDETAIKNYLSGKQNDRIIKVLEVSGSDNESQDEFDNKVLEVANSFGNNPEITYFFSPRNETEGNCNTSSSTILIKSGLSREKMSSIKDMLPITTVGFSSRPRPWTKDEQRNAVSNKKKIEQFRLTFD